MIFRIHSLLFLFVASVALGQDFANETYAQPNGATPEIKQIEKDPEALPKLAEIKAKIQADLAAVDQKRKADFKWLDGGIDNLWRFRRRVPTIPAELEDIVPPAAGMASTNGFVLKMYVEAGVAPITYWGVPSFTSAANTDVLVAVSTNSSAAGYLGETDTDGVIRVDSSMGYSNGVDYITLSALDNKVAISTNSTGSYYLGEAFDDGVLRTTTAFDYVNGTEFITLGIDYDVVATGLVDAGIGGDIPHTELDFSPNTQGAGAQNSDHDRRYWAHGMDYNDTFGGLWGLSIGYGSSPTAATGIAIDLSASKLWSNTGTDCVSVDWDARRLYDEDGGLCIAWRNRSLNDWNGTISVEWDEDSRFLRDLNGKVVLGWGGAPITPAYDYAYKLMDTNEVPSVSWNGRTLLDSNGQGTPPDGLVALDWENRQLINTNGTLALDWSGMEGWVVTNIQFIAPGGTTNTMTVLAKP